MNDLILIVEFEKAIHKYSNKILEDVLIEIIDELKKREDEFESEKYENK